MSDVSIALRDLPEGPVRALVVKLCATDHPRRSNTWVGGRGYIFFGDEGRECKATLVAPLTWRVTWTQDGEERSKQFTATVTWSETG